MHRVESRLNLILLSLLKANRVKQSLLRDHQKSFLIRIFFLASRNAFC